MQWHTPIGYKVINGKIEVYEEHRKIVEGIFRDYDSGVPALQIAKRLREQGIKNANDRVAWTHASVGKILENHNYLGTEDYPQIIENELFDRVQKRRELVAMQLGRGKYRPEKKERLLFGGMLVCAECGGIYSHVQPRHGKRGEKTPQWRCRNYIYQNRASCRGGSISDRQAEKVCVQAINTLIRSPDLMEKQQENPQRVSMEYRKLEKELGQLREENAETSMEELTALIYERAQERYRTLEIRDKGICSEEMKRALTGREELTEFDEELYRKLIKRILVYKNHSVMVIFKNDNRIRIGYGAGRHESRPTGVSREECTCRQQKRKYP